MNGVDVSAEVRRQAATPIPHADADRATLEFLVKAGAAIRGHVRREIESAAWSLGLHVDVEESKGLFVSLYKFEVSGPEADVRRFSSAVQPWLEQLRDR